MSPLSRFAVPMAQCGAKSTSEERKERKTMSEYKIVAAGADTFIVNYKFVNEQGILSGESLPDHIQEQLDEWQKAARKEQKPMPTSLTFSYTIKSGETVNQSLLIR